MSWYDVQRWERNIQLHTQSNTWKSLLRCAVSVCSRCSSSKIDSILSMYQYLLDEMDRPPTIQEGRLIVLCFVLRRSIHNKNYESLALYYHVRTFMMNLRDQYEYLTQHLQNVLYELDNEMKDTMPVWYARGLLDEAIPLDSIDSYEYASFDANLVSYILLKSLPVYNDWEVLINTEFEDGDAYRELFHTVFTNPIHSTQESVETIIQQGRKHNFQYFGKEEWNVMARITGYDSYVTFIANYVYITTDIVIQSHLSLEDILYIVRETTSQSSFYNPLKLAFELGKRPDITYDYYINVLQKQPWWNEECPPECLPICSESIPICMDLIEIEFLGGIILTRHKHVFREFISHIDEFREILCLCKDIGNWGICNWKSVCSVLSMKTFLQLDDILELPEVDWSWEDLSRNPAIATPDNILTHPELPWVWGRWGISASPAITKEFIMKYWENGINFGDAGEEWRGESGTLSGNHTVVTSDLVDTFPEHRWSYKHEGLSSNPNITLPWLRKHLEKPWDIETVVFNVSPDRDIAANAIQSWWLRLRALRRCAVLAFEVEEWWYSPDCNPAVKMREDLIWSQYRISEG